MRTTTKRALFVCGLLAAAVALGQSITGTLTGTVTDPNSAVVPGVRIK